METDLNHKKKAILMPTEQNMALILVLLEMSCVFNIVHITFFVVWFVRYGNWMNLGIFERAFAKELNP